MKKKQKHVKFLNKKHGSFSFVIKELNDATKNSSYRLHLERLVSIKNQIRSNIMRDVLLGIHKRGKYDGNRLKVLYYGASEDETVKIMESPQESIVRFRTEIIKRKRYGRFFKCPVDAAEDSKGSGKFKYVLRLIVYTSKVFGIKKSDVYLICKRDYILVTHLLRCFIVKGNSKGSAPNDGMLASKFDRNRIFQGTDLSKYVSPQKQSFAKNFISSASNFLGFSSSTTSDHHHHSSTTTTSSSHGYRSHHHKSGGNESILDKYECMYRKKCRSCNDPKHVRKYFHPCKFGKKCRNQNSWTHLNQFYHPCKHGHTCDDETEKHRMMFSHPTFRKNKRVWRIVIPPGREYKPKGGQNRGRRRRRNRRYNSSDDSFSDSDDAGDYQYGKGTYSISSSSNDGSDNFSNEEEEDDDSTRQVKHKKSSGSDRRNRRNRERKEDGNYEVFDSAASVSTKKKKIRSSLTTTGGENNKNNNNKNKIDDSFYNSKKGTKERSQGGSSTQTWLKPAANNNNNNNNQQQQYMNYHQNIKRGNDPTTRTTRRKKKTKSHQSSDRRRYNNNHHHHDHHHKSLQNDTDLNLLEDASEDGSTREMVPPPMMMPVSGHPINNNTLKLYTQVREAERRENFSSQQQTSSSGGSNKNNDTENVEKLDQMIKDLEATIEDEVEDEDDKEMRMLQQRFEERKLLLMEKKKKKREARRRLREEKKRRKEFLKSQLQQLEREIREIDRDDEDDDDDDEEESESEGEGNDDDDEGGLGSPTTGGGESRTNPYFMDWETHEVADSEEEDFGYQAEEEEEDRGQFQVDNQSTVDENKNPFHQYD